MATTNPWGSASSILAGKSVSEDGSYYRDFTSEDQKAVLTVPMRIQAAWATNDAEAFADVFADNGSLLMGDTQLTSSVEIRSYMIDRFNGSHRGARVKGWPIAVRFLTDDVALVVTEGGIIMPGQSEVAADNVIRAMWVIAKRPDGQLKLVSHQSSPVKG